MSTTPGGTDDSWMQRARRQTADVGRQTSDDSSTAATTTHAHREGWDPYEVWLSRIERPRRQRQRYPAA
jgi:hypothetical protein